jgi:hypothetical protein
MPTNQEIALGSTYKPAKRHILFKKKKKPVGRLSEGEERDLDGKFENEESSFDWNKKHKVPVLDLKAVQKSEEESSKEQVAYKKDF